MFKKFEGGNNKVKCTAKNARPAPSFVWTVDEVTLDHKTENIFDEESAVFTQILHFVPGLEHTNKTLRCSVRHPGLEKDISAGTEVRLRYPLPQHRRWPVGGETHACL